MIKKAMVLAAGFGKRLHPLTVNCPKPLLKIGNETLLSNTLKFLKSSGIEDVVINVLSGFAHLLKPDSLFINANITCMGAPYTSELFFVCLYQK